MFDPCIVLCVGFDANIPSFDSKTAFTVIVDSGFLSRWFQKVFANKRSPVPCKISSGSIAMGAKFKFKVIDSGNPQLRSIERKLKIF